MRVWLWLVYKFNENYCRSRLFSDFIQTQKKYPTSWQNTYPNLKTTCHIKLKLFLWTKLLENLLLAKYLISVAAPLTSSNKKKSFVWFLYIFLKFTYWFCVLNFFTSLDYCLTVYEKKDGSYILIRAERVFVLV